jgi:hypothetical protein
MKKAGNSWLPLPLGVLLMATVVGVASARPNARPLEQAWRVLAVSPYACTPDGDVGLYDFRDSNTDGPRLHCETLPCRFYCAIDFPAAGEQAVGAVNIKRVTMFAYDDIGTGDGDVSFALRKSYGPTVGGLTMAWAPTTDSASTPQTVVDTSIENNPIYRTQAPFIRLNMEDDSFWVSGFFIHYTW